MRWRQNTLSLGPAQGTAQGRLRWRSDDQALEVCTADGQWVATADADGATTKWSHSKRSYLKKDASSDANSFEIGFLRLSESCRFEVSIRTRYLETFLRSKCNHKHHC